jgi:CBS domain-containing protein
MPEGQHRLEEIATELREGRQPEPETVRTLLQWFGAQRRGYAINQVIEKDLDQFGIKTQPDFRYAYIDSDISFVLAADHISSEEVASDATEQKGEKVATSVLIGGLEPSGELTVSVVTTVGGAVEDPTYRIGKLAAANNPPVRIKPDGTLEEAVTLMLTHDFSQLPIMQTDREVKGIVTWASIGGRLALGNKSDSVRHYMERHRELNADVSLFAAISMIVEHGYVLIRDGQNKISGIVTTSDLSLQFRQLGEPFLLIGEIENHIRRMVDGKFTPEELKAVCDPGDTERQVSSVSDLTFGEYLWLLQNPAHWERLGIAIDRKVSIEKLDKVRQIRNDVMHFDPDGLSPDELEMLRSFVLFLQKLREITNNKS